MFSGLNKNAANLLNVGLGVRHIYAKNAYQSFQYVKCWILESETEKTKDNK